MVSKHKRLYAVLWTLVALSLGAPGTAALNPTKSITQYQQDFWGEEDGLPQASVQALMQTRAGYIWIGTRDGLARFDGTKFTVFRGEDHPGLCSDDIRSLYEDNLGRLWVGTFNGGVSCLENGVFRAYSEGEGLGSKGVLSIYQDYHGNLWFGTWRGIARFNRGRFDRYFEAEGVEGRSGWSFAEDSHHRLWAATERALHRFEDRRFEARSGAGPADAKDIRQILIDRTGAFWIGTLNGLIRLRGGEEKRFTTAEGLCDNRVRSLAEDRDGNIWIATWEGLARIHGEKVSSVPARSGDRLNSVIDALLVDADGSLWIGLRGAGLARLRDAKFTNFSMREGLPSKLPRCILQTREGPIWVGTDGGGLARIEGERVERVGGEGLPSDFVASLAEDAEGRVWAGLGRPAAIARVRHGAVEKVLRSSDGLPFEYSVRALHFDRNGVLWAGGDGGLCRVEGDRIETVPGLPNPPVRVIAEDREGRLWVGTDDGLCVFEESKLKAVFRVNDGLSHNAVYSFHQDEAGVIWLGTQQGVTQYKNGRFRALRKLAGGFNGTIYSVLDDSAGTLWTASSRGISAVSKRSLEDVLDGQATALQSVTFGTGDGLKSTQCIGGSQSPSCRTRDGRLWFATLNGFAILQPDEGDPHQDPPRVILEEIRADRAPASPSQENTFGANTDDFEFHYTALRFITPEKVRFRYQLDGHDKDWVPAETRRTAYYNNLRPGTYRFRVSASTDGKRWSQPVESARFVLRPHFYQTAWFYLSCLMLVGTGGWGFHRQRLRKQQEQFTLILAERTRIARDLHDTMAQGFAGTAFQLEALRSAIAPAEPEARRHLDLALMMVRHSFAEAKGAVMNLRSPILRNGSLVAAVSEMGKQMVAETGLILDIKTDGEPPALDGEVEQQLLRICQEALANAVKHANATRIELSFDFERKGPRLSIRDNGRGFNLERPERSEMGHLGLKGMRERVKQMGGVLQIRTAPGAGTEIVVQMT